MDLKVKDSIIEGIILKKNLNWKAEIWDYSIQILLKATESKFEKVMLKLTLK